MVIKPSLDKGEVKSRLLVVIKPTLADEGEINTGKM